MEEFKNKLAENESFSKQLNEDLGMKSDDKAKSLAEQLNGLKKRVDD